MNRYTDTLYASPSFLEGVARILDFGNTLNEYNTSLTPQQADERALAADWYAIGEDMKMAVQQVIKQTSERAVNE